MANERIVTSEEFATGSMIDLILAPTNLGLRPHVDGREQGTWRAPEALLQAGLAELLGVASVITIDRPGYERAAQPGTRIRNGLTIRAFSLLLADHVQAALQCQRFPVVIGGDCSILLGCLLGLRRTGGRGLVHVDGHSDFFHPGNYDVAARLGSVAGMDLALATGRGEDLLTIWPEIDGPLVDDRDAFQVGERDVLKTEMGDWGDIEGTAINRVTMRELLNSGASHTVRSVLDGMHSRQLTRSWLHVDLDVLDQAVMPAVDSPGSPGLDFGQLRSLLAGLVGSGKFVGLNVSIFDPDKDPKQILARAITVCISDALSARTHLASAEM